MKQSNITGAERVTCKKVRDAFTELYEETNVLVVEAGKYGREKRKRTRPKES